MLSSELDSVLITFHENIYAVIYAAAVIYDVFHAVNNDYRTERQEVTSYPADMDCFARRSDSPAIVRCVSAALCNNPFCMRREGR